MRIRFDRAAYRHRLNPSRRRVIAYPRCVPECQRRLDFICHSGESGARAWVSDGGETGNEAKGRGSSQEASEAKDVSRSYCHQEGEERRGWSRTLERNARAGVGSAR